MHFKPGGAPGPQQDPVYFVGELVTSAQFKREPDGAKWNPTPCEVELPPTPRPQREPPPR